MTTENVNLRFEVDVDRHASTLHVRLYSGDEALFSLVFPKDMAEEFFNLVKKGVEQL